ncbi:DUF2249 domain-containing protein [Nocardiopsis listeri]|uniref:DUF2249 domain-containing protein n=1 Tax=Nocardiopsis listeri TaxID=53440 RepID=UPI000836A99F|nr:DUF2249 domain-containing protein [Nocardiopsis listeri]
MESKEADTPEVAVLDVRGMRKPDKHPTIFRTYADLPVGGAFVLVNDHDPKHLRDEFEDEYADGYGWDYLNRETRDWRIQITKEAATALPRVLVDTSQTTADNTRADMTGALWKLQPRERDLDSQILELRPEGTIETHTGPDFDVLVHVLSGGGHVDTELDTVDLAPGAVLWLPRRSRRSFTAGPEGLRYLSVHRRRQGLPLADRGSNAS